MKNSFTVMKIGGSCLKNAESLDKLLWIRNSAADSTIILVCSAFSKITDSLILTAELAGKKDIDYKKELKNIKNIHENLAESIFGRNVVHLEKVSTFINQVIQKLEEILEQIVDYGLEKFRLDYVMSFGEKLSTFMIAEYLLMNGSDAVYVAADELIVTDDRFGNALPLFDYTERKIKRRLIPILTREAIPCITGFIGLNKQVFTTTLGRGGSEFTATIVANILNKIYPDHELKVILWKDVDGILSASPQIVSNAHVLQKLSYAEAKEIAYFGSKVLHPKCIMPLEEWAIPLEIKNFNKPDNDKFTIVNETGDQEHVIKGISVLKDVAMISARSSGLVAVPGTLAKIFSVLGEKGINVSLVSQSSSEINTTFCVSKQDGKHALEALTGSRYFKEWFDFSLKDDVAILSIIGFVNDPTVKNKVFLKLAEKNIEVIAVAQSADGLNISLVVKKTFAEKAIQAIHEVFHI
ncbi:MAG: aspartate kinase [Promethearchaeota archaeon]